MLIEDHVNLLWGNPLVGINDDEIGPCFPDMTDAYSPRLRTIARRIAANENIHLWEGVYVANIGPTYETPAETMMAYRLGGDLVGMSSVPDVIVARHMNMECWGFPRWATGLPVCNRARFPSSDHDPATYVSDSLSKLLAADTLRNPVMCPAPPSETTWHMGCRRGDIALAVVIRRGAEQAQQLSKYLDNAHTVASRREYITITGIHTGCSLSICSTGFGSPPLAIAVEEIRMVGGGDLNLAGRNPSACAC